MRHCNPMTEEQAAIIREYEAGYRVGHKAGYADAETGRHFICVSSPQSEWRKGHIAGYAKGWLAAKGNKA